MNPLLTFNGIDIATGGYATAPMEIDRFVTIVKAQQDPQNINELKGRQRFLAGRDFAPIEGVDPKDLSQAGWGVIYTHQPNPAIQAALKPLLDLRRTQASAQKAIRYQEYFGPDRGYRVGADTKSDWLERNGAGGGGAADPDQMPYYLMIVGSPTEIPFTFQYQLDVQYAVGRLYFGESPDEYARYAEAVVAAETGGLALAKRAVFFGVSVEGDAATTLSANELTAPLADQMTLDQPQWSVEKVIGEPATKSRLASLMGGDDSPALLFTASHGAMLNPDNPLQKIAQGALLTQDWPGPGKSPRPMPEAFYFSGQDIPTKNKLAGQIAFHFACFGGGTPAQDDYVEEGTAAPKTLAPNPFIAHLPQRMLSNGALATVGHIDRAWAYSFKTETGASQVKVFKSAMKRLMEGHPVGSAMEYFNNRYAELSSDISAQIRAAKFGTAVDPYDLSFRWQCASDARNYAVNGDPAVRLFVTADPAKIQRPAPRETIVVQPPDAPASSTTPAGAVAFGPLDFLKSNPDPGTSTLQQIIERLTTKLSETIDSVTTLEVLTYTASDLSAIRFDSSGISGAHLRAVTRIGINGNTINCMPEKDGQIDTSLWQVHADMVAKASSTRSEMLKLAASATASLASSFKIV